ncbi:MAG: hypothetical protein JSR61_04580 [Proteobacteria bacterium]|nr:hypothetical protein [Pseudomonadota bacterium]
MPLLRPSLTSILLAGMALPWAGAAAQTTHVPRAKPPAERSRDASREQYRPGDIVCTKAGCRPMPAGCHAVNEETWEGPTGYAIIICP